MKSSSPNFADRVLHWFARHGRKDLPWQQDPTPYRVWVSEIMLQQTQVGTVIDYYRRFMARFPDVHSLASAELDQVLHLWTGLGYYARARNLHKAATLIVAEHNGEFPADVSALESLPGIGRSTAGAIAALSMNIRAPILDGNVKRVLTRYHGIEGWPEQSANKARLWQLADALTPDRRVADYTQAMMDLGAMLCTRSRPDCGNCPLIDGCIACKEDRQAEIPGKKPKKALPVKSVVMYIIQNDDGDVMLEKRPAQGIWGGLYSFPEYEQGPAQALAEPKMTVDWVLHPAQAKAKADKPGLLSGFPVTEVDSESVTELPPLRHTFSHYHLDITPVHSRFRGRHREFAEPQRYIWYPLDGSIEVGLAAPIKKLLARLPE